VEALATLEVAVRPGFETIRQILIATIEIPDDSVVDMPDAMPAFRAAALSLDR